MILLKIVSCLLIVLAMLHLFTREDNLTKLSGFILLFAIRILVE